MCVCVQGRGAGVDICVLRSTFNTSCKIICGAPTTLAVKGLMMMMMMQYGVVKAVAALFLHCVSTSFEFEELQKGGGEGTVERRRITRL